MKSQLLLACNILNPNIIPHLAREGWHNIEHYWSETFLNTATNNLFVDLHQNDEREPQETGRRL